MGPGVYPMSIEEKSWYRLDNTGTLYPSVMTRRNTTLFRMAVSLDHPVHVERLAEAVPALMERFPYYRVQLRPGAFWYSFEENPRVPRPVIDSRSPCGYMPIKKRGVFPFRIRAYGSSLAVEFSHSLTDGTGAMRFLKALLTVYHSGSGWHSGTEYHWRGKASIPGGSSIPGGMLGGPEEGEYEDAFRVHYDPKVPSPEQEKKVFHIPGKKLRHGCYRVLTGEVPVKELIDRAKNLGVSLTEYLTALYFSALQEIQEQTEGRKRREKRKPLSVMVPVNLRGILPSSTMRNFFLTLNPLLDTRLGHYEFEEIAAKVHHFMRTELDYRHLRRQISRNVRGSMHPLIRISPLFVKNMALKSIYRGYGENTFSGSMSNLGRFTSDELLSDEAAGSIRRVSFVPPPSPVLGVKCGAVSYGETLSISFGSLIEETALERLFFTSLRKSGVPVRLRGNWKEGEL